MKKNNIQTNDIILPKIGSAFLVLLPCYIHEATKWDILLMYHKWLVASTALEFLYKNKPNNWIEDARKMSVQKYTAMRNIISLIYHLYYDKTDSVTSVFYTILDNLFGREQWYDVYLSKL